MRLYEDGRMAGVADPKRRCKTIWFKVSITAEPYRFGMVLLTIKQK